CAPSRAGDTRDECGDDLHYQHWPQCWGVSRGGLSRWDSGRGCRTDGGVALACHVVPKGDGTHHLVAAGPKCTPRASGNLRRPDQSVSPVDICGSHGCYASWRHVEYQYVSPNRGIYGGRRYLLCHVLRHLERCRTNRTKDGDGCLELTA